MAKRYARRRHAGTPPPMPARLRAKLIFDTLTNLIAISMIGVVLFLAWPLIVSEFRARINLAPSAPSATTPAGNVGGQAPPVVRGSNPEIAPAPAAVATPIPGIAQNQAEADTQYQEAINAAEQQPVPVANPTPDLGPLPLNSAGAPIIDAQQQQQLDQSAQMAADEQQAVLRAAALADAQSRAPDVSKADAEQMLHRDLCHVPRADPHTCEQGLYKPTPIGAP